MARSYFVKRSNNRIGSYTKKRPGRRHIDGAVLAARKLKEKEVV